MKKLALAFVAIAGVSVSVFAANVSPKARMTSAAYNVKIWQSEQKTAIAAATKAAPTPTKTSTPKPTLTPTA